MNILVVSATTQEVQPFLNSNPAADILISGVGATQTSFAIQQRLWKVKYDLVVQAGVAGTFNFEIAEIGNVVSVDRDVFADEGVWEPTGFISKFEMGLADKNEFPYTDGWLVNNASNKIPGTNKFTQVHGITVNAIHSNPAFNHLMRTKYNAVTETMEGAALHYVCLQMNIPFLQIRAISNIVGERDKQQWDLPLAINNLNNELIQLWKEWM